MSTGALAQSPAAPVSALALAWVKKYIALLAHWLCESPKEHAVVSDDLPPTPYACPLRQVFGPTTAPPPSPATAPSGRSLGAGFAATTQRESSSATIITPAEIESTMQKVKTAVGMSLFRFRQRLCYDSFDDIAEQTRECAVIALVIFLKIVREIYGVVNLEDVSFANLNTRAALAVSIGVALKLHLDMHHTGPVAVLLFLTHPGEMCALFSHIANYIGEYEAVLLQKLRLFEALESHLFHANKAIRSSSIPEEDADFCTPIVTFVSFHCAECSLQHGPEALGLAVAAIVAECAKDVVSTGGLAAIELGATATEACLDAALVMASLPVESTQYMWSRRFIAKSSHLCICTTQQRFREVHRAVRIRAGVAEPATPAGTA